MSSNHQDLAARAAVAQTIRRIGRGARTLVRDKHKSRQFVLCLLIPWAAWHTRHWIMRYTPDSMVAAMYDDLAGLAIVLLAMVLPTALLWAWGGPIESKAVQDNLIRAGLVNAVGEAPMLEAKWISPDNPKITVYEFFCRGVPLEVWKQHTTRIDSALNITTADTRQGHDNSHVLVYAIPGTSRLAGMIPWNEKYAARQEGLVVLGESLIGPVKLDLNITPMAIIGGTTGSGKSQMAVLAAHQLLQQGAQIIIADYKGCADWDIPMFDTCQKVACPEEMLPLLQSCVAEMERRQKIFRLAHARNLPEYMKKEKDEGLEPLRRIVICVDEAADVLGQNVAKSEKAMAGEIEALAEKIARRGRSSGINLILAIQRPDSSISGQVRSNCPARYCGMADRILRDIVLGDTLDETMVWPDTPGRFIANDGTLFQAYYYDGYKVPPAKTNDIPVAEVIQEVNYEIQED